MSQADTVHVTAHAGVAVVTLDDPHRRNALTRSTVREFLAAIDRMEADPQIGALVVTGTPPAFCAGADLADLIAAAHGDTSGVDLVYECFGRIADSSLPTVAAVDGAAVGAGLNLALACDIRIASERARFDSRFLDLGIHPGGGHAWMLQRLVGPQVAAAMVLCGRALSAEDAVASGLALEVVPAGGVVARAVELAERAASYPAALLRATKQTLREVHRTPTRAEALAVETERQRESLRAPEALGRLEAMLARISGNR